MLKANLDGAALSPFQSPTRPVAWRSRHDGNSNWVGRRILPQEFHYQAQRPPHQHVTSKVLDLSKFGEVAMERNVNSQNHLDVLNKIQSTQTADLSFLETVLEDLQDEVYVYACDTLRVRYTNNAARNRVGWTAQEAVTKCISDTVATFNLDDFHRKTAPLLDGREDKLTVELIYPTGPIEVSTKLLRTKDEGDFFISVARDLSCRKSLENEKLHTVSTVSHELRTPLTSIHGAMRLLKAGVFGDLDDNTQGIVEIASRNTDRLLSIVNDILDFEKIKSNNMDFSIVEMDILKCLEDTIELVSGIASENNVTLEIDTQVG